ncbi:MAG: NAD-dependent protein deacetylase [Candidatus Nanopelagicales bacterium]|nr:NAD-dependent protein deacetylase [Candidatus Nanopelagicales bacterium]
MSDDHDRLKALVQIGGVVVLSGAGISTDSGIPDYRGASGAALRKHAPMTFQAFIGDPEARHRYWARSHVGWPMMRDARPNAAHHAVASWQEAGVVTSVVTQNVDSLHTKAGSLEVVDLHGRLDRVVCLDCSIIESREVIAERLEAANPGWRHLTGAMNPDGDVDLTDADVRQFTMVSCTRCGGVLKPDVVYFGETVPRDRVVDAYARVDEAQSLLVLGSSLHVYSGRRFVLRAVERGIPVAIVNQGPTRADDVVDIRIDGSLGEVLVSALSVPAWNGATSSVG